jgi:hypothetical protein
MGEQVELLLEQLLVAVERIAEERERLGERTAPEDHLGATAGDRIDGGEALVHPDRVVGAEHGHSGPEADPLGARCDCGEHGLGRRDREVVAVVFADAEEVEAEPVGKDRLVDDIADHLRFAQTITVGIDGDVPEGVEAQLDRRLEGGDVCAHNESNRRAIAGIPAAQAASVQVREVSARSTSRSSPAISAQLAQQKIPASDSTPWPRIRMLHSAHVGAIQAIAHSTESKIASRRRRS